jgi:hypothetical protein
MNSSIAVGGSANGQEFNGEASRIAVPVWTGERDENPQSPRYGEPVFGVAYYRFVDGAWLHESAVN